ncbi:RNA polymerase sigma-54 factor [Planctomycetales bacterium]|nr:RNA polymerase sigma-54 factor [Planctomycetales bacterium]
MSMRFSLGQELRLEQRQILAQKMIQSMEILQLNQMRLEERIDQELQKNPVLEFDDSVSGDILSGSLVHDVVPSGFQLLTGDSEIPAPEETFAGEEKSGSEKFEREPPLRIEENSNNTDDFEIASDFADTYSDTIDEAPARSQGYLEEMSERRAETFANIPARKETLQEYLISQLVWFSVSEPLRDMTERIINNLNKNGYFPYSIETFLGEDAAAEDKLLAEDALKIVRRLEPAGVGAKDLEDCLLLQVKDDMPNSDVLRLLIKSYIEDIANNRIPHIIRSTGLPLPLIQRAIAELRQLKPHPGAEFSEKAATAIIPDIIVEKDEEGNYTVRLAEDSAKHLRVNSEYQDMAKQKTTDKEIRKYLRQNIGTANWFIEAIEQRKRTLLEISRTIIQHQINFFEEGPQEIKPLKMQQIAEQVGVHITTVSRACEDKWMLTPHGVYPFKRFFSGCIASTDGTEDGGHSQDSVKRLLRELIDRENKKEPLNDDMLVKKLAAEGIKVARRTVVKYRQAMNIPSSRGRKEWG